MKHILKHTSCVWWSVLLATGFLCGCASTTQVLPKPPVEKPTPNKALIVVERPQRAIGCVLGIKVYDNNTFVGEVGPGGKLIWLRDPGLMRIDFREDNSLIHPDLDPGRCLVVEAGERYYYTSKFGPGHHIVDGPGIPAFSYVTEEQTPHGSLVFFRILTKKPLVKGVVRTVKITNIQTGKLIQVNIDAFSGEIPWLALYLPLGEYYVSTYEINEGGYNSPSPAYHSYLTTYKINAELSITKPDVGIYIGDISLSGDKLSIRQDSIAAREFFKQNSIKMPYTEAIMEINR